MWEIEASDDDIETEENDGNADRRGKNCSTNSDPVPVRIALLFVQIEKDGPLKLKTSCGRRGPLKRSSQDSFSAKAMSPENGDGLRERPLSPNEYCSTVVENAMRSLPKPEMKAFSYEDDDDLRPNTVTPRRNLSSAKKPKKIATMTNVVNDLIRHKILDELENSTNEGKTPATTTIQSNSSDVVASNPQRQLQPTDTKKKAGA